MSKNLLKTRLEPILEREKRLRRAQVMSVCWLVLTVLAGLLLAAAHFQNYWVPGVVIGFTVVALAAAVYAWFSVRDNDDRYRDIARKIERGNPELNALLLTAIEQEPKGPDGQLSYLQTRVLADAEREARRNNWVQIVPEGRLRMVTATQWLLMFAFIVLSVVLFRPFTGQGAGLTAPDTGAVASAEPSVDVVPGDVEVEKGSRLVVTAEFTNVMPGQVLLLLKKGEEDLRVIEMERSLDDPLFGGIIPEVNEDLTYQVEYDGERTEEFAIATFEHPELQKADAHITPPEYSELEPKLIEDTKYISVLERSGVELRLKLNKPVDTARLTARGEDETLVELAPSPEDPTLYVASLEPTERMEMTLHLLDSDFRKNKKPAEFTINVQRNLPPELKPIFPRQDIEASPIEELSLEAELSDDVGLASYGASYTLDGVTHEVTLSEIEAVEEDSKKRNVTLLLNLERMGAQADQLLSYHFWAEDQGPDGEVRRVASDMYFAELRPFDKAFHMSDLAANGQQGQDQQQGGGASNEGARLAELQKLVINATWRVKRELDLDGNYERHSEDIEVVRDSQREVVTEAEASMERVEDENAKQLLTEAMELMREAHVHLETTVEEQNGDGLMPALGKEQAAYQKLLEMRAREVQLQQQQQQGQQGQSSQSQRQMEQMEMREQEQRYETESQAREQNTEQEQERQENLQILNRLRELARRQGELNEKLKELQAALQEAETEEEKDEIERELKRLREQQQRLLEDLDEVRERMDAPENSSRLAEEREQLENAREKVQEAGEQMDSGEVDEAINTNTRAERELETMRDEFREKTAGQFTQEMRELRKEMREIRSNQENIAREMRNGEQQPSQRLSLKEDENLNELNERMREQRERVEEVVDRVKQISEESEQSEPLLSKRLYEAVRQTNNNNLLEEMRKAQDFYESGLQNYAQASEELARQGVEDLTDGIEEAAESVLGDEAEALRVARSQLNEIIEEAGNEFDEETRRELAGNDQQGNQGRGEANQEQRRPEEETNRRGQPGQTPGQGGAPTDEQSEELASSNQPGQQPGRDGAQEGERQEETPQDGQGGQGGQGRQPGEQVAQNESEQQPGEAPAQGQGGQPGQGGQGGKAEEELAQNEQLQSQNQEGQGDQGSGGQQQDEELAQNEQHRRGGEGSQPGQGSPSSGGRGQATTDQQTPLEQLQPSLDDWDLSSSSNVEGIGGGRDFGGAPRRFVTTNQPITGENFRDWSDRMRDLEETLDDPELRNEVARIRDRAQAMRIEARRHANPPSEELMKERVMLPLLELRSRVEEQLTRLESEKAVVPIDHDPVVTEYSELVRRYYETLGEGR